MKKLLQINVVVNSESTGRIAEEIGQVAINAGWDSYIAYGREKKQGSSSKLIRIGGECDIRLHGIQTRVFDNHSLGHSSRKATKQLIKRIEEIKPDIIQLHNVHGYYLNVNVLFNYLNTKDIPLVWTLHDCWPFTGHCSHFDYIGCEKWKKYCHKCPLTKGYPSSLIFDRSFKNFEDKKKLFTSLKNQTFIPVSKWLSSLLNQSFLGIYPSRLIHNGINTQTFYPKNNDRIRKKYNLGNRFTILGVANTWSLPKGLNDFIWLSSALGDEFRIIIVGVSSKQKEKLPPSVIGVERTDSVDELAEFYSASDLFVNPTYQDNFPTTNIEALACGTPVITYHTGGSPETIDDTTGVVVEKGDRKKLLHAIFEIKKRGKKTYSDACRNRALLLYRKEDRFREYIELYESLVRR